MSFKKILNVAGMEFKLTAVNKAFVIITIIGPFLILAISVLPTLFASSGPAIEEGTAIAVVGGTEDLYQDLNRALGQTNLRVFRQNNFEQVRQQVLKGSVHGILVLPQENPLESDSYTYYSKSGSDFGVYETLKAVLGNVVVNQKLAGEGLDPSRVRYLTRTPGLEARKLAASGEDTSQDFMGLLMTGMAFVMLIYMTVLLYGQMIARSVLTEKTSKTVEIMLSSVQPLELLYGKIFGKGVAGILQYIFWGTVAVILVKVIGPAFDLSLPASLTVTNLLYLIVFFILAFFLYAAIYGALGAGAEDDQHLGQLQMPVIMLLVLPLVLVSAMIMNPNGALTVTLSFVPFTAPIVMLLRIIISEPPVWEILVSIGLQLLTITGLVYVSAKIFRVGVLMTGKRPSITEILRWVRY
ncbi:MAG: ABC transporter permease [Spirochaetia bacterium]